MHDAIIQYLDEWDEKYNRVKREAERMCRCFSLVKSHYLLGVCNVDEVEMKCVLWEEDFVEVAPGVWRQKTIRIGN